MKKILLFLLCWFSLVMGDNTHFIITGAGATFPYPLYTKWAEVYEKLTGVKLNYQSIGSGGGVKQIKAGTVDFGATDKPLTETELRTFHLVQFPTVLGAIVPIVNLPQLISGQLKLNGKILAAIYLGEITYWDDVQITALNPHFVLPHLAITVVHRSDASGTTYLFTKYLVKVSSSWASKVGSDTAVAWPVGIGGKGNEGVASYVKRIKGTVGYIEFAYAKQNNFPLVALQNRSGQFVEPSLANFQASLSQINFTSLADLTQDFTDLSGSKAWPILGTTYILIHAQQKDLLRTKAILDFFKWAFRDGATIALSLDYIPLPTSVHRLIFENWHREIKDSQGKPIEFYF